MSARLLAAALAAALLPLAGRAADAENPYKNAKVGDYAAYTMAMKVADQNLTGTITSTVTAKTDKEVRQARTAIRNLGGFAKAMKVLGRYASSKGKDVSKVEKKNVTKMVTAGGAVVADALGVKACFELVSRTL